MRDLNKENKKIYLKINSEYFYKIIDFLLKDFNERAVFLLVDRKSNKSSIIFEVQDVYKVPEPDTDYSPYSLLLNNEVQAHIIKWAWKKGLSLVECHSHPFCKKNTSFSFSDIRGFQEFVPHIWWRLKNKPYIAIVFGMNDFDAIAWIENPNSPSKVEGILVDNKLLKPTNITISN